MNKYHSFSLAVVALAAIFVSCTKTQKADETSSAVHEAAQWFAAGSDPSGYLMSTSSESAHGGKMGGFIRSLDPDEKGFGTYMQMIKADAYRGKQVKMTDRKSVV